MLFNSIEFAIFLPIVFLLYWAFLKNKLKLQNLFLVLISYIFYGWWDWRFLSLIIFSSLVDYLIGLALQKNNKSKERKILLATSVIVNIGLLGFFKYFNFFAENFQKSFTLLGSHMDIDRLNIILPVGISFYTFQTLSYTIDVYKKKIDPTKDIVAFFAFVSFFPQLVAGPIERARNLLPQFYKKRFFEHDKATDGLRQILWGFFKKIVIADNCAIYVNQVFNNTAEYSGSTLLVGAIFFAFQIYGDFSGYSDIAIGTARLFGFNLMRNFAFPYFSRDIAEFWRRWHISLSAWFRDYLYFPLGGSRGGAWNKIRNTFIIFLISGFWHGANWTFIVWGFLNALYFLPLMVMKKNRHHLNVAAENSTWPSPKEGFGIFFTFLLTTFAWIFFRAENISHAFEYISKIFSLSFFTLPDIIELKFPLIISPLIILLLFAEWLARKDSYALDRLNEKMPLLFRWILYYLIVITILLLSGQEQEFIYFQF